MATYKHISSFFFIVFLSLCCIVAEASSARSEADSLMSEISNSNGEQRIEFIRELLLKANRFDERFRTLVDEFIEYAAHKDIAGDIALGRFFEGNYFLDMKMLDSAYLDFSIALDYYSKVNDSTKISAIYSNMGIALKQWGAYKKAIEAYQNSIAYCGPDKKKIIAQNYYNAAVLCTNTTDYASALRYINLAEQALGDTESVYGKALILYQKANIYNELHLWGKNLEYALLANAHIEKHDISSLQLYSYLSVALAYNRMKDHQKAFLYADSARVLALETTSKTELASIEKCYGLIYLDLGQYKKATDFIYRSYRIFIQDNNMKMAIESLDTLARAYQLAGNPSKAIEMLNLRTHISDSLSLARIEKGIANTYSQMEIERSLNEINQLKAENDINKLTIRSQYQTIAVIFLTLVALLLAFLLFFKYYRKIKTLNLSLNESNRIISESKSEIFSQLETIRQQNAEQALQLDSLKKSESELRTANATKDRLFSIISHDLKGPVFYFVSNLQNLKESLSDVPKEEIESEIDMLISGSQKLILLLKNLLVWAGLQRNTVKYERKPEELAELLGMAVEPLMFQANFREISIKFENCESKLICDSDIVSTIVRNLVSNAIKHSRRNGHITIGFAKNGDTNELFVRDNGYGIPPEILESIESENHLEIIKSSLSSGLGIMLCRELARIHGGELRFESTVNLGTTVRFYFR